MGFHVSQLWPIFAIHLLNIFEGIDGEYNFWTSERLIIIQAHVLNIFIVKNDKTESLTSKETRSALVPNISNYPHIISDQ